jgi:hypothetical protein
VWGAKTQVGLTTLPICRRNRINAPHRVADSLDVYADDFMEHFPTMAAARGMLGDRFEQLREKSIAIWRDVNAADDGSLRLPQEYLLSIVRL